LILLKIYLIGSLISLLLCLWPILKAAINKELLNILDVSLILIIGFIMSWFGVFSYIYYKTTHGI